MKCLVWNPEDDYAYVGGRKTVLKVGLNKQYLFVNGQWQTTDREDNIPQLGSCAMDGGIEISDGTLALERIGGGHGRATQIRIENQGKPIVIKYRTSPSASVSEQELRFDTQLYQTSYLVLASSSWGNPITYYIHMELFNSRQTQMVISSGTWQQNPVYITEIYVDA